MLNKNYIKWEPLGDTNVLFFKIKEDWAPMIQLYAVNKEFTKYNFRVISNKFINLFMEDKTYTFEINPFITVDRYTMAMTETESFVRRLIIQKTAEIKDALDFVSNYLQDDLLFMSEYEALLKMFKV